MKKIIALFTVLMASTAFAKFDLMYGAQGRTYPAIGGSALVDSGYNFTLWGTAGKNPMYGLVRPYLKVMTSAVVNTVEGAVEIYPISFIGFVAGKEYNNSSIDLPFFDCDAINCQGNSTSTFTKARMALGFAGFVAIGEVRKETVTYEEDDKPFGDFFHALVADSTGEEFLEKKFAFGYDNGSFLLAVLNEHAIYKESDQEKNSTILAFRKYTKDGFWTVGAGNFEAGDENVGDSQVENGTIFVFQWMWKFSESLKLF